MDLSSADTPMSDHDERRSNPRITHAEAFSLKIIFTSENPGLLGKSLHGSTVDVSASGLKLSLDAVLPIESTIDVVVTLKGNPKQYFLSGKVKWCKKIADDDTFYVGVSLQNLVNTETDFNAWRMALKNT